MGNLDAKILERFRYHEFEICFLRYSIRRRLRPDSRCQKARGFNGILVENGRLNSSSRPRLEIFKAASIKTC